MLEITIPSIETYDEAREMFVHTKEQTLRLEHSLVSISKWESKHHRPFLSRKEMTDEESIDYIRFMTLTPNVDPNIYTCLPKSVINQINSYLEDPATATTFKDKDKGRSSQEIPTSELIYYWMIALDIPSDYEKWNLNRLLTLVKICNIKNSPSKKMSKKEVYGQNKALNAARKQQLNTRG